MRIVAKILIAGCVILFAVGAFAAWQGSLPANTYIIITGIIGSTASVIGLVALFTSKISSTDVREIDAELFKNLAETAQAVKDYEKKAIAGREEIDRLAAERADIELLVRQASLKAFIEERLRYTAIELDRKVQSDEVLSNLLNDYDDLKFRLKALDGVIERSERADHLQSILRDIERNFGPTRSRKLIIAIAGQQVDLFPILNELGSFGRAYANVLKSIMR
ncbi:hypothetical protein ACFQI3_01695 [Hansschlegelia quercus]|uniref:DNA recombination protein RmuC homolog n=1 Tax=Hansschlegelia quercus TaxID=2528245 RepID=A0A4Q9GKE8_9HYPH|nr:hypothetical protein [Hansschlegelia quercus]TBN54662.1 hypothetical protein EYR15_00335 [Hansschlegelia quercus]